MTTFDSTAPAALAGVRTATVVGLAPLRLAGVGPNLPISTLAPAATPVGSRVVVATTDDGTPIVLGVIGGAPATSLPGGYTVRVTPEADDAAVTVSDAQGATLLRFDAASGTLSLSAHLDLHLNAGRTIRLSAPHTEIGPAAPGSARLSLRADTFRIASPRVECTCDNADLKSATTSLRAGAASATFDTLTLAARRARVTADRVQTVLRSAYTDVKQFAQVQAGRLKLIVTGTTHVRTEEFNLRADRNVNIDGDRVNLG